MPNLIVDIIVEDVDEDEVVDVVEDLAEPIEESTPAVENAAVVDIEPQEPVDWHAEILTVVAEMSLPSTAAPVFNTAQEEQRRRAAAQFAPIPSHEPVPVWDNVFKDMTGRSVLQHGDCQRVINDPNASTREAFETFGQYIVTCSKFKEKPRKLAWVSELESRREGPSRYGRPTAE